MELSWKLVQQIISMVLMGLAGYGLGRLRLVNGEQSRVLSCVCVYLAVPSSLITSFHAPMERDKLAGLGLALAAAVLIHLLYLGANALMHRGGRGLTREEQASVIYNNAGNLIMPMVMAILGPEYVIYTSSYILVQNLLMWTHGQKLMGGAQRLNLKKILSTPAIVGILAGLVLFLTGLPLPGPLTTAMEGLGGCMGPLSMLVIGILFSELDLRQVFLQRRIYWVALLRLVFYPLLTIPVLLALGRLWPYAGGIDVLTVCLLCAVGPAASAVTQMAQLYHNPNSGYVSSINVLTTLLCAATMPVMFLIFQLGMGL